MTDLAVVKLDSTETLPFAKLGDSDDLKIGQVVYRDWQPVWFDWRPNRNSWNS